MVPEPTQSEATNRRQNDGSYPKSPPQLPDGAAVGVSDGEPDGVDDVGDRVSGHVPHMTGHVAATSDALGPRQALLFRLCGG